MPNWYRNAYVTVLPSIDSSEAFGIVLLEAQGCGSPVIASDLPGVRGVLENNKTGFIAKAGSVDDLAEKLENLLTNPDLQKQMSHNASARVEQNYQWKKVVKELLDIYNI